MSWKTCLQSGLKACENFEWRRSEAYFLSAMADLEIALSKTPLCPDTTAGWVAAHHGFAALYGAQGDGRRSFRHLMIPHRITLLQLEQADSDAQRLAAQRTLRQTLPPLLVHAQREPLCAGCRQLLERSQALLPPTRSIH